MRLFRVSAALVLAGAVSAFAFQARAAVLITVDKASQRMSVVVDGERRWTWPVSTGKRKYDTPNGGYTTFRMVRDHRSREWDDAPMPYSIFFTRAGHAIHGSYAIKRLGRPASHGCVRLAPKNAARLFALVRKHGMANTRVVVNGALTPRLPIVAVPLPRKRGNALRQVAKLQTPVVSDVAPAVAATAAHQPDVTAPEHWAFTPLPPERRASRHALPEPRTSIAAAREAAPAAEPEPGPVIIAAHTPATPVEVRSVSTRIIPLPRERRPEMRALAEPETPAAAKHVAPDVADAEPGPAMVAARASETPVEERRAVVGIALLPRERQAEGQALAEPETPVATKREATIDANAEHGPAIVADHALETPAEERRVSARSVTSPRKLRAERHALPEPEIRAAALREAPADAYAKADDNPNPGKTLVTARAPETLTEERLAPAARTIPLPPERRRIAVRTETEPPRQQAAIEQPPQQAKRKLPKPQALPESPRRRRTTRTYDDPPDYRRSRSSKRLPRYQRRWARHSPRVYYDPRAEIIQEFYVNGHWVRRRYYRRPRPQDFYDDW